MENPALQRSFYRTDSGQYYPAIQRLNGVRLILKSIATTINPSCLDTFEDVCGDSMRKLLDFLQYACMPNPTRVEECPPGNLLLPICFLTTYRSLGTIHLDSLFGLSISGGSIQEGLF